MGLLDSLRSALPGGPRETETNGPILLSSTRKDFEYVAVAPDGSRHRGRMQASSASAVSTALQQDGWVPITVREGKSSGLNIDLTARLSGSQTIRLTVPEAAAFFRQVSELLRAGVPITKVMTALGEETSPKMKAITLELGERLTAGQPLSEAMTAFPDAFDEISRAYVAAGEASGTLSESMARLARILEKRNTMRLKIKAVTAYPKMVGGAIGLIVVAIMLFLVPRYEAIYAQFGSELPLPTRILVGVSQNLLPVGLDLTLPLPFFLAGADVGILGILLRIGLIVGFTLLMEKMRARAGKHATLPKTIAQWGFILVVTVFNAGYEIKPLSAIIWGIVIGAVFTVRYVMTTQSDNPQVIEALDTIRFRIPIFGPIVRKNVQFQWASTMGGTLGTGIPQLRAITLAGMTSGSRWIQHASTSIEEQVRAGRTLSEALSEHPKLFSPSLRAMVATGETTGDMATMFDNIAATTDAEIDALVAGLSAKVEVALLMVMAAVVGSLLVALYLPIIQLATTVSGGEGGTA